MISWKYSGKTGLWSTVIYIAGAPVKLVALTFEGLWFLIEKILGRNPL
ncbi:MAG: hypothetical protein K5685_06425 [Bacteroidales bacterium]|nr:hypothetical protein [Bacteroidales bacterium]